MRFFNVFKRKTEKSVPVTHNADASAFVFSIDGPSNFRGERITIAGFNFDRRKFKEGDFLILKNEGNTTTRYQIEKCDFPGDPDDQYFLRCKFAPRPAPTLKAEVPA